MEALLSPVGVAILAIVVAILVSIGMMAKRYRKAPPNEVLVIAGRKHSIREPDGTIRTVGHRIVKGGGTFIVPILETVSKLSLNAMTIEVSIDDAYTKQGVPVIVDSVVVMKIGGDDISIANASERFLGFESQHIERVAKEVLGGHLRAICSTMTPEEINQDRTAFQQKVLEVAHKDFQNMGLAIDSFTVRQIRDKGGYFESLGKKSTAEVKRNARIGEAEALEKDAIQKESEARQAGQTTKALTEAKIAEANKDRDVKMAGYSAEVATERAKADQAGPKAEAQAKQDVVEAQTDLAGKEAERKRKELLATVVRPAEANKEAAIATAEGEKFSRIARAEAHAKELELEGDGTAKKTRQEGLAEAEVIKVKGEAEGAALKAKAVGLAQYNDAGMKLQITMEMIHTLPEIIKAAVAPLGAVDSIRIVDLGGGGNSASGDGAGPLGKLLGITPKAIAVADETLRSTLGMSLADMLLLMRSGKAPSEIAASGAEKKE